MNQEPTYTPPPKEGKGPWGMLQARILLALSVPVLLLLVGVYFLVTHLFPSHQETPQQRAARQQAQQYEQTAPPNPNDIAELKKRAERNAAEQANAANLAKILHPGLNPNATSGNPLAVPGNPMNTDPQVYKTWVDADASARQAALSAPGGNMQPTPGNATGNVSGANPGGIDQSREDAKKRKQQSLSASMMVIDFTAKENAGNSTSNPVQDNHAAVNAPQTPGTNPSAKQEKEPIALQKHYCYELCEGDHIDAVLVNRLDGSAPGYVDVEVTEPVFSHDFDPKGRRLLIPIGSRVLGEVFSVGQQHQERLYVAFHKLRRPDGSTFPLDNLKGLDQAGAAGLRDQVNNHLVSKIATAGAIAALGTLTQINNVGIYGGYGGYDWGVQMRNGLTAQIGQTGMQMFQQKLNQLPSMTAREGKVLVKVYLNGDYSISEYVPRKEIAYVP